MARIRHHGVRTRGAFALLGLAALAFTGAALAADYRLQPGDVLELSVTGRPDVRESMPVNIDGNVIVPLAGVVSAAGRSLTEVSEEIRGKVSRMSMPGVGEKGMSTAEHIHPSFVTVSLRGYRPVYVEGGVRDPGAHPFVPGLTARQAIALAGGTSRLDREQDPALQMIEIEARIADLGQRRAASQARIDRLRAELATDPGAAAKLAADATRPGVAEGVQLQLGSVEIRRAQADEDIAYLDAALKSAEDEITSLTRQLAAETDGSDADAEEYARLAAAQVAGTVTSARLNESRRGLLFAQSSKWETQARLAGVEREKGSLLNLRAQRRLRDLAAANEALSAEVVTLGGFDAELAGARERLGFLASRLGVDGRSTSVRLRVTRADGTRIIVATGEDPALLPGDLVTAVVETAPMTQ